MIAHVACDGAGTPAVAVAELLGVSGAAISLARIRGRELLSAHGWSLDEVLSWRAATFEPAGARASVASVRSGPGPGHDRPLSIAGSAEGGT